MIFWDVTRTHRRRDPAGLTRTNRLLRTAVERHGGEAVTSVVWSARDRGWRTHPEGATISLSAADRLVTAELGSSLERPGWEGWLAAHGARTAAVAYDVIPLTHPHWVRDHAVARHPYHLYELAACGQVWAISRAVADQVAAYWDWCGVTGPAIRVLPLGADALADVAPSPLPDLDFSVPLVLQPGTIEPRKNVAFSLAAAEQLWDEGMNFTLLFAGRPNRDRGGELARALRKARRQGRPLQWLTPDDATLAGLYAAATVTLYPSAVEGLGLPVLEALHAGCPVIAGPVPAASELAATDALTVLAEPTPATLADALRTRLETGRPDALSRPPLPTWQAAGDLLSTALA